MNTEDVISKLNKNTRKRIKLANELSVERLKLPSPNLTSALNGGLGYGRQSLIWGTKSAGKAQPVDTIIPTPDGYKKFGDINIGDYVWDGNGKPVKVVAIHPQGVLPNYRVEFNDGTETYCNEKHLWTVQTVKQKNGRGGNGKRLNDNWKTLSLSDIINSGLTGKHKSSYKFYLPPQQAIEFSNNSELPIDPYLLGCMLGDGSFRHQPGITVGFEDDPIIVDIINSRQDKFKLNKKVYERSTAVQYSVLNIRDTLKRLNLYGLFSHEKHIPSIYMNSSVDDRIALLQGIMDADGHVGRTAPHKAKLTSSSKMLIEQTAELVRSLGGYAYENSIDSKMRPVYSLSINTPFNPFMMPRKAKMYVGKPSFRAIAKVEEAGMAEMMCITVDSVDGLYMTNDFIITHNSSLCLETVGNAQRDGKVCAWIDAEQSFDPTWAVKLGVNVDELIVSPTKTISDLAEIGSELMAAGVDVLVVDSISALLPTTYFEKDKEELKDFTGTRQIGSESKDMANAVKILNYANDHTALILISQIRNKIFTGGAVMAPTGGNAVSFYSSTSIKLVASSKEPDQIKAEVVNGNNIITQPVGREVNWLIEFNKIGAPLKSGKYNFYYDGDFIGVDKPGDAFRAAVAQGIIEKNGAWYSYKDYKWQGEQNGINELKSNDSLLSELESHLV